MFIINTWHLRDLDDLQTETAFSRWVYSGLQDAEKKLR